MTTPRLKRHNFGRGGHAYTLDCDCPGRYRKTDPHKIFGVTTALGVLNKAGLVGWAGRITAEYALDHWEELALMQPSERLDTLRSVQFNTKKAAALRGNQVHAYAERLAAGHDVPVDDIDRGPVEALARWLDREEYVSIAGEVPCVNTQYRYGGTLDSVGVLGRRGETALIDFKRTNAVYDEVAYQLTGYRYCDLWQPDGPKSEQPMPQVDAVYVVHIKADSVEMHPVEVDDSSFAEFTYILQVARDQEAIRDNSRIGPVMEPLPPLEEDTDD